MRKKRCNFNILPTLKMLRGMHFQKTHNSITYNIRPFIIIPRRGTTTASPLSRKGTTTETVSRHPSSAGAPPRVLGHPSPAGAPPPPVPSLEGRAQPEPHRH